MKQSAFPVTIGDQVFDPGMTLRDYFAAKAMQSELINNNQWMLKEGGQIPDHLNLAKESYLIADAMLKAREL